MATNTEKLNLKLPGQEDFYNVEDFNENFQKVDDFAKRVDEDVSTQVAAHTSNTNNPHNVTKEQLGLGAVSTPNNGKAVVIGKSATATSAGVAIGNSANAETGIAIGNGSKGGGVAIGTAAESHSGGSVGNYTISSLGGAIGQEAVAGDGFSGGCQAKVGKNPEDESVYIDAIQLGTGINVNKKTLQIYEHMLMDANGKVPSERLPIAKGSYVGTGTQGSANVCSLTFPFVPKIVFISQKFGVTSGSNVNYCPALPMVNGCDIGFISLSSSSREAPYNIPLQLTWNGTTLTWYYGGTNKNKGEHQLNATGETYYWVAIG